MSRVHCKRKWVLIPLGCKVLPLTLEKVIYKIASFWLKIDTIRLLDEGIHSYLVGFNSQAEEGLNE